MGDRAAGGASEQGAPVLVVDDDASARRLTAEWLRKGGFEPILTDNGQDAVLLAAQHAGDLAAVVLDVVMPGMGGFQVLEQLKTDPSTQDIPVILVTALAHEEDDVVRGIELGAADHLDKPFRGGIFLARLRATINRYRETQILSSRVRVAEEQATTDPLTGLHNRRAFDAQLEREIAHCKRHEQSLALAIVDLDRFKQVNDVYGHAEGDRVLKHVADRLRSAMRQSDQAFRIGGEEFVLLLRDADVASGVRAMKRIRAAVKESAFKFRGSATRVITFSAGVAAAESNNDFLVEGLVERADRALYQAKRSGRDQVVGESPTSARVPRWSAPPPAKESLQSGEREVPAEALRQRKLGVGGGTG